MSSQNRCDANQAVDDLKRKLAKTKYNKVPALFLIEIREIVKLPDGPATLQREGIIDLVYDVVDWDYLKVTEPWQTSVEMARLARDLYMNTAHGAQHLGVSLLLLLHHTARAHALTNNQKVSDQIVQSFHRVLHVYKELLTKAQLRDSFQLIWSSAQTSFYGMKFNSSMPLEMQLAMVKVLKEHFHSKQEKGKIEFPKNRLTLFQVTQPIVEILVKSTEDKLKADEIDDLCFVIVSYIQAAPLQLRTFIRVNPRLKTILGSLKLSKSIGQLKNLMNLDSALTKELLKEPEAAARIQAVFKGTNQRKRFLKMKKGIIALQRRFRWVQLRRRIETKEFNRKERIRIENREAELKHCIHLRKARLATIASIAPGQLESFLRDELHIYAAKIQRAYRAHRIRRRAANNIKQTYEHFACQTIQRFARQNLAQKEKQGGQKNIFKASESERKQLQTSINQWIDNDHVLLRFPNLQSQNQLFQTVQEKLEIHLRSASDRADQYEHGHSLIRRIESDVTSLQAPPRLGCKPNELAPFYSGRLHIQRAAKQLHETNMRRMHQSKLLSMLEPEKDMFEKIYEIDD